MTPTPSKENLQEAKNILSIITWLGSSHIEDHDVVLIATALDTAFSKGRVEGLEEAAQVAENMIPLYTAVDVARAIRRIK